jgi:cysteine desulfurase/selenocysteine lyase
MQIDSPWKHDFPVFSLRAQPNLCYFDSAATCLTPKYVADAVYHYQCFEHANSHKGLYQLSAKLTDKVEMARLTVAKFIGAEQSSSVVFTKGATEALNLLAYSFVEPLLINLSSEHQNHGSNIVLSVAEHHANLLPWQRLAQQYNVELRFASVNEYGQLDVKKLTSLLDSNTVLLTLTHCSNVLGQFNPVNALCKIAREKNIPTIIDGAQAIAHGPVNVVAIDCDFYVFSGHKIYGPSGCGVLYAKHTLLAEMRPYQVGGGIISSVDFDNSQYLSGPLKFEAGSHNVASIIGLAEALQYLNNISWPEINSYLSNLSYYLHQSLIELDFLQPLISNSNIAQQCPENEYASLCSFALKGLHCHDVASLLDSENIALRAGHHCAQPLHKQLKVNASVRVSLGIYNESKDVDKLIQSLKRAHQLMAIS